MVVFNLRDGTRLLRANLEINGGNVTLHSRRGPSAGRPGINPDYSKALETIVSRLNAEAGVLTGVSIVSRDSLKVDEAKRVLVGPAEIADAPTRELLNIIRRKMRAFGRSPGMNPNQGNSTKRLEIRTSLADVALRRVLRVESVDEETSAAASSQESETVSVVPLSAQQQRMVRPEHIHAALARLSSGESAENFGPSTYYDVWTLDGKPYPPKWVFGFALEKALGIEAFPKHFEAGWGTICFELLEAAGLFISPKNNGRPRPAPSELVLKTALSALKPTEEERSWIEGNPKIATHLVRERAKGLAKKKRDAFIAEFGRLFCQNCEMDPIEIYGREAGTACIEVHHHRVHVAEMGSDHETKLEDLKCLCANCHRVLHRELTLGKGAAVETELSNV